MPTETANSTADGRPPQSIGAAYLAEARANLAAALAKITHCLDQLGEQDVQWRPHATHNSIQTIVLHLCGNLRQWIVSAIGGEPDTRDRPAEFAPHEPLPKAELVDRLKRAVAEADAALAACPAEALLDAVRVQGFETTKLAAIFGTVSHFEGHTHQIVYITRWRIGDAYRFAWAPATKEQGA